MNDLDIAYSRKFDGSNDAQEILKDLEKYCFEHVTTFQGDPYKALINEGRRSVLLHIRQKIKKGNQS